MHLFSQDRYYRQGDVVVYSSMEGGGGGEVSQDCKTVDLCFPFAQPLVSP